MICDICNKEIRLKDQCYYSLRTKKQWIKHILVCHNIGMYIMIANTWLSPEDKITREEIDKYLMLK